MPSGRLAAALEVLAVATRLGLTSFGGPVAHLGYFRSEYVVRRRWVDEQTYADLVALCQFLPGPASSQVGIALGIFRAGLLGGLAAWLGFTLPSAIALVAFALGVRGLDLSEAGLAPRPQGRGGGGGGAGGVGDGAHALPGPRARLDRDRGRAGRHRVADRVGPGAGDRRWRASSACACSRDRATRAPRMRACRIGRRLGRRGPGRCSSRCWSRLPSLRYLTGVARARGVRQLLPRGRARLRRRARRAAPAAGRGGAARLGDQRAVPRRLRRRAGGAGAALHLRGVPGRGHAPVAERLARGARRPGRDLPARRSCWSSARCRSGTPCGPGRRSRPRCAGSTPRSSACCSPRSIIRSGRARSTRPPTSPSRWPPSACSPCGARRPGSWWPSPRRAARRSRCSAERGRGARPLRPRSSPRGRARPDRRPRPGGGS